MFVQASEQVDRSAFTSARLLVVVYLAPAISAIVVSQETVPRLFNVFTMKVMVRSSVGCMLYAET